MEEDGQGEKSTGAGGEEISSKSRCSLCTPPSPPPIPSRTEWPGSHAATTGLYHSPNSPFIVANELHCIFDYATPQVCQKQVSQHLKPIFCSIYKQFAMIWISFLLPCEGTFRINGGSPWSTPASRSTGGWPTFLPLLPLLSLIPCQATLSRFGVYHYKNPTHDSSKWYALKSRGGGCELKTAV